MMEDSGSKLTEQRPTASEVIEAYRKFVEVASRYSADKIVELASDDEYHTTRRTFEEGMNALPDNERQVVWDEVEKIAAG